MVQYSFTITNPTELDLENLKLTIDRGETDPALQSNRVEIYDKEGNILKTTYITQRALDSLNGYFYMKQNTQFFPGGDGAPW